MYIPARCLSLFPQVKEISYMSPEKNSLRVPEKSPTCPRQSPANFPQVLQLFPASSPVPASSHISYVFSHFWINPQQQQQQANNRGSAYHLPSFLTSYQDQKVHHMFPYHTRIKKHIKCLHTWIQKRIKCLHTWIQKHIK